MSFDNDGCYDDGPGYDESYDASDDIYAGTAACDDGSDQAYEDRHEGEDVDGEMGEGQDRDEVEEDEEGDEEPTVDPHGDGREAMDGYVD